MGYVEVMEVIKRVSAIPIPEGATLIFTMIVGGLTFTGIQVSLCGRDVRHREITADWEVNSIPTDLEVDRFLRGWYRIQQGGDPR